MNIEAYRQSLSRDFAAQSLKVTERFGDMVRKQLMWQPEFDKWSIGQCLYHIWLTNEKYLKILDPTVRHTAILGSTEEYRSRWLGRRFIGLVGPRGIPGKVPRALIPVYDDVPEDIVQRLEKQFETFQILIEHCKGKDLMKIRIHSPFMLFIRFQVGDILKALEQHNERHIAQATRITKLGRFPALQPVIVSAGGIGTHEVNTQSGTSLH